MMMSMIIMTAIAIGSCFERCSHRKPIPIDRMNSWKLLLYLFCRRAYDGTIWNLCWLKLYPADEGTFVEAKWRRVFDIDCIDGTVISFVQQNHLPINKDILRLYLCVGRAVRFALSTLYTNRAPLKLNRKIYGEPEESVTMWYKISLLLCDCFSFCHSKISFYF